MMPRLGVFRVMWGHGLCRLIAICLVGFGPAGCATYLGYHDETDERLLRTLDRRVTLENLEVQLEPAGGETPGRYGLTLSADEVKRQNDEVERTRVKVESHAPYDPGWDVVEYVVSVIPPFQILPIVDILSAVAGVSVERPEAFEEYPPGYFSELKRVSGYLLPGVNALYGDGPGDGPPQQNTKLLDAPRTPVYSAGAKLDIRHVTDFRGTIWQCNWPNPNSKRKRIGLRAGRSPSPAVDLEVYPKILCILEVQPKATNGGYPIGGFMYWPDQQAISRIQGRIAPSPWQIELITCDLLQGKNMTMGLEHKMRLTGNALVGTTSEGDDFAFVFRERKEEGWIKETRKPVGDPEVVVRPVEQRTRVALAHRPVTLDLGPAGTVRLTTDGEGRANLDLTPYFNYVWADYAWPLTFTVADAPQPLSHTVTLATNDLGITWAGPRVRRNRQPARLLVRLELTDAGGNRILEAGETATARLRITNNGAEPAWGLRAHWRTEGLTGGDLTLSGNETAALDTLAPGRTWTRELTLRAGDEWNRGEPIVLGADVEQVGLPTRQMANATLAVRPYDPPDLRLVRMNWVDTNNGVLEPGDVLSLNLMVQNLGLGVAREVHTVLRSRDPALALNESFPERVTLASAETRSFAWNVKVPAEWHPADPAGRLPIEVQVREDRERYSAAPEPLPLALGARSSGASAAQQAADAADLQKLAGEKLAQIRRDAEIAALLARKSESSEAERRLKEHEAEQAALIARQAAEQAQEAIEEYSAEEAAARREQDRVQAERRRREEARRRALSERNQLRKRSYAVIVGVDRYDDETIQPLTYAAADARAFAQALGDPECGLFAPENITLLVTGADAAHAPTGPNILDALKALERSLGPEDRLLFYFAGHGTTDAGRTRSYLLPQDARLSAVAKYGLALSTEVLGCFDACRAGEQIVIVDACHSGLRKGERTSAVEAIDLTAELKNLQADRHGRVVFSSSERGQVAHEDDELGHGVFTHYLVDGLRAYRTSTQPQQDWNLDRVIEARELFEHVRKQVEGWCRRKGRTLQQPLACYDAQSSSIRLAAQPDAE